MNCHEIRFIIPLEESNGIFYCAGTGELMSEIVKSAANLGIAAVLLFIFVEAFLKFYQKQTERNEALYAQFTSDAAKREEQYRQDIDRQKKEYKQRESILVAESARREELLKEEAAKRELLLKQESSKREAALINTIEGFTVTMEKISRAMEDMKDKIGGIEDKIKDMGADDVGQ